MKVKITFTEECLGTKAADPEVFNTYIASKAPDDDKRKEEQETAEHCQLTGTTIFHREEERLFIYDYQIKGFFKDACASLRQADGTLSAHLRGYKTKIDGLIFIKPRKLFITLVGDLGNCQRPLLASTPEGPRVALANSEAVQPGSTIEFDIHTLAKTFGKGDEKVVVAELIQEWLDYGQLRGLGAWRNSGKGRFGWQDVSPKE